MNSDKKKSTGRIVVDAAQSAAKKTTEVAKVGGEMAVNFGLMWGMLAAAVAVGALFVFNGTAVEKLFVGVPVILVVGLWILGKVYRRIFPAKPSTSSYKDGWS
jgi:uncharacterized membrane protein